jgi:hypothetical protein
VVSWNRGRVLLFLLMSFEDVVHFVVCITLSKMGHGFSLCCV